jgi:uncharacterized protein YydD (DUF2326 family)
MFLHELGSPDARFKDLTFHDGMNLLVADKTEASTLGDSRNGAGKSSFVRILRYLLGGDLHPSLRASELSDHVFRATVELDPEQVLTIERQVSPTTKLRLGGAQQNLDDWKAILGGAFALPEEVKRPTVSQLVAQLVRTYFADAIKTHQAESGVESGIRIGYFLGFSPEILGKAGEVLALDRHRKALNKAIADGALPTLNLNEPEVRARLAQVRARRTRLETNLVGFRVDEQYADHQALADRLSLAIRDLNDEALVLEQRKRELQAAMKEELSSAPALDLDQQLQSMYQEIGIVLPDTVSRRFDEVADFHASVVRNRQLFLQSELQSVEARLVNLATDRTRADGERASVMTLLNDSMALDTFRNAERELAELDATIADLERRLELAQSVAANALRLKTMAAEAESGVRIEIAERTTPLEEAIALFTQLGEEIYSDRAVSLLIDATSKGVLKVVPKIDGDASMGISEVKTFLLDIVCLVMAVKAGRAPRLLVHDSLLFDSMDDRQMASCLNIGSRLADQHGFQYIVTINSDRLEAAERAGFDRRDYVIDPVLTDFGGDGGLFGFRFV